MSAHTVGHEQAAKRCAFKLSQLQLISSWWTYKDVVLTYWMQVMHGCSCSTIQNKFTDVKSTSIYVVGWSTYTALFEVARCLCHRTWTNQPVGVAKDCQRCTSRAKGPDVWPIWRLKHPPKFNSGFWPHIPSFCDGLRKNYRVWCRMSASIVDCQGFSEQAGDHIWVALR